MPGGLFQQSGGPQKQHHCRDGQAHQKGHGEEIVRGAKGQGPVLGQFLGKNRHCRETQGVGGSCEQIDRGIVGGGKQVHLGGGPEGTGLQDVPHHPQALGHQREECHPGDGTQGGFFHRYASLVERIGQKLMNLDIILYHESQVDSSINWAALRRGRRAAWKNTAQK